MAPKKYVDHRFTLKSVRLVGSVGDGLDMERAAQRRALTREMLMWFDGETQGKEPGAWARLISRYITDEDSDI